MTLSETIELIEKAMEGVTPGPWQTVQTRTDIQRLTVAGPSEIVCGLDGICEPDRMNDRLFAEDAANMRYIAACNPVAISAILAEARKAEALKREIAELREAGEALAAQARSYQRGFSGTLPLGQALNNWDKASTSARTLLNGGSDAQG